MGKRQSTGAFVYFGHMSILIIIMMIWGCDLSAYDLIAIIQLLLIVVPKMMMVMMMHKK